MKQSDKARLNGARAKGALLTAATLTLAACADEPTSSASENVAVIEPPMVIDGLGRERTIRIYVPPGYEATDQRYPVLYMHDGQNLFDDATSYAGEWGVDETLDAGAATSVPAVIVVGIDNGGEHRMRELSPWRHPDVGEPEAEAYLDFVVDQVKPWVDGNYRTLPGRESTAIMGSSMGGLVSHYALFRHPDVFRAAGVFSPSYWISDRVYSESDATALPKDSRVYLLIGGQEGEEMVEQTARMGWQLFTQGMPEERLTLRIVPGGRHHEKFWRDEFAPALRFLFATP